MKVLHVYKSFFPFNVGGVETVIREIALYSNKNGVKSDVLSFAHEGSIKRFKTYKVINIKYDLKLFSTPFSLRSLFIFRKIVSKYDIIHFHYPFPFADLLKIIFCPFKKSVVTYHSDIVHQKISRILYYPLETLFLKLVNKIIYTSPNYLKISKNLQKYFKKSICIPIGIDFTKAREISTKVKNNWLQRFNTPTFLFVGAARKYKGLDILLKAAEGMECNFLIASNGKKIEQLQKRNKLKNVKFVLNVSDAEKNVLLHLCYGLILPSTHKSEAFGIVLVEAAAHEKPIVSCEIGTGTSFININAKTGFVVPPKNYIKLREAIAYLLYHPKLAKRMGKSNMKLASSRFSNEKMGEAYLNIYYKVFSGT